MHRFWRTHTTTYAGSQVDGPYDCVYAGVDSAPAKSVAATKAARPFLGLKCLLETLPVYLNTWCSG